MYVCFKEKKEGREGGKGGEKKKEKETYVTTIFWQSES